MRKLSRMLIWFVLPLILTSCWNYKTIQSLAYVTAMGIDYQDGKVITYVQVLNFSNIAKSEGTEFGKEVPVWIGRGEGRTVNEAFSTMNQTSQIPLYWGHVKAIVCTEEMLKHGIKNIYEAVNRYREIRYNILVFGTKEKLEDIFTQKSLLNFSPIETLLESPDQSQTRRSFIPPIYGFRVISQINEPGMSAMMPSLGIDKESWKEDKESRPMFKVNGAYFFTGDKMQNWMSDVELNGIRWIQPKIGTTPLLITTNKDTPAAVLKVNKTRFSINPVISKDNKLSFNLKIVMQTHLEELLENMPIHVLEDHASRIVREDLRNTYQIGVSKKCDPLKLNEVFYRKHVKKWKELHHKETDFILKDDSLDKIDVKVQVLYTGKYKTRTD